jgi:hypothetical protein
MVDSSNQQGHLRRKILYNLDVEYTSYMVIALQILLMIFMLSITGTLTQVNLIEATNEKNSTTDGASAKNEDVFALLQLEKDVSKHEGSLKDLHSGNTSPFDLIGEVKNDEKFKPESGSFLPEYDDTQEDNDE